MKLSFSIFERSAPEPKPSSVRTGSLLRPPMPTVTPQMAAITSEFQELNRKMFRAYDAALTTNFNSDFKATYGAPNTEIIGSKYQARGRARTLAKDTPHGKAVIRTFQNNVVGDDPFKLDMRFGEGKTVDGQKKFIEDSEVNRVIEEEWEKFGQPENFNVRRTMSRMEAWRIMEGSAVREGSILQRHYRNFPFNDYGYAIDLLEEDRLQESYMGKSPSTGRYGGG